MALDGLLDTVTLWQMQVGAIGVRCTSVVHFDALCVRLMASMGGPTFVPEDDFESGVSAAVLTNSHEAIPK